MNNDRQDFILYDDELFSKTDEQTVMLFLKEKGAPISGHVYLSCDPHWRIIRRYVSTERPYTLFTFLKDKWTAQ